MRGFHLYYVFRANRKLGLPKNGLVLGIELDQKKDTSYEVSFKETYSIQGQNQMQ